MMTEIEWSEIWSEILCLISILNECTAQVEFEITGMISDQNFTTQSSMASLSNLS